MNSERIKIFLLAFAAQLIITSLIHLGVKAPGLAQALVLPALRYNPAVLFSPQSKTIDPLEQIKGKLKQPEHQFTLVEGGKQVKNGDFTKAVAFIVVDLDSGQILAAKDRLQKLPIASLTKIMTAVVASDLADENELFAVSTRAARQIPTKIGVVAGQKMSFKELLEAMLLTSANDAAKVIEEGINQKFGRGSFTKAMNMKADILGLKNTHFTNPSGFDSKEHFSTVSDLVVLTHYALTNYPLISEIVRKEYQFLPEDQNHKQFDLYNWNGLLGVYPGALGVKIGNTGEAGYTTIVASERGGKQVLAVLLGAPGVLERDLWTAQLLDLGFNKLGLSSVGVTESQLKTKYSAWKYWN